MQPTLVGQEPATLNEKVADFLAQRRIAVAGVSARRETTGNLVYRKLKKDGHAVVAISPTTETFDGDRCYPNLAAVPEAVDGLFIATRPALTLELVQQCVAAGVPRVWMHESLLRSGTSVSAEAVALCLDNGIRLIAGACPMMYGSSADFGHRCMRWMMQLTGGLPR
ncbi:MAG: CoA-binding protein [Chloroflexaceae bacterium]|nr:CoA-binding protein [Chloroflexaceae bacterium]